MDNRQKLLNLSQLSNVHNLALILRNIVPIDHVVDSISNALTSKCRTQLVNHDNRSSIDVTVFICHFRDAATSAVS